MAGNRVRAVFGGLEVQVQAVMSRTAGVVPDTGMLRWRGGTTLPAAAIGDLVFYNGDTEVVRFTSCILDDPREERSQYIDYVYLVKDRRWKWDTVTVFGEYNVRDEQNALISITAKTPRQLATLLLTALGESSIDVSALPTDAELSPHVQWHYTPAAEELQKLCDIFAVEVHLLNDDSIALIAINSGSVPDDTGLELPPETGISVTPIPPYVTCYANDTIFDEWLLLEPCVMEIDGTVVNLAVASYIPTGGWDDYDPTDENGEELYESLKTANPTWTEERLRATVDNATRTVYRMYRVTGFGAGVTKPNGYDDDLPAGYFYTNDTEDEWQWVATDYSNMLSTYSSYEAGVYGGAGFTDNVFVPPGHTVIHPKLILPLEATRMLYGTEFTGINVRRPAELFGLFTVETGDDQYKRYSTADGVWRPWLYGFSVNPDKGYVFLNRPAYLLGGGKVYPAKMYLRTGFGWRLTPYGNRYHRHFNYSTGSALSIANATVPRLDLHEWNIRDYAADDYKPYTATTTTNDNNRTALDAALETTAEDYATRYVSIPQPLRKQYTPLRAIDTNGNVQQVTYSAGGFTFGRTIASIGAQFDLGQPPAKKKRAEYLQRKQIERQSARFADEYASRNVKVGLLPQEQARGM